MAITQRGLTLEEFLNEPEEKPALEFVDGMVTQKVSPKFRHTWLQSALCTSFNAFAVPRRLGGAFPEGRATFAGSSVVPDVVFFRWERIPRSPERKLLDDAFTPPAIAVEIRSPGQSVRAQVERCRWYVANGVEIALQMDPDKPMIRLFRPGIEPRELRDDDPIDLSEVLPGFQITVRQVFDMLEQLS